MEAWYTVSMIGALAYAPGVFWLWYFFKKDLEPEPLHLVRNCFLLGMLSVVPAGLLEGYLPMSKGFQTVIAAPIIEESCKFLTVYFTIYGSAEFDEPMDGVIYSVAVALGFASLENVFYLYRAYQHSDGSLTMVTLIRAVFSVPGHALFAVMWGYPLGIAKFSDSRSNNLLVTGGLILGMMFHAVFNGLTLLGPLWPAGMLILVVIMWQMTHKRIEAALHTSPHAESSEYRAKLRAIKPVVLADGDTAWHQNRAVVIILLFVLCFPVGLYGLVKNQRFSLPEKCAICVLWLVLSGALAYTTQ
jgi:RsiW-degrading membrane proteinase PrsW (M82 family)